MTLRKKRTTYSFADMNIIPCRHEDIIKKHCGASLRFQSPSQRWWQLVRSSSPVFTCWLVILMKSKLIFICKSSAVPHWCLPSPRHSNWFLSSVIGCFLLQCALGLGSPPKVVKYNILYFWHLVLLIFSMQCLSFFSPRTIYCSSNRWKYSNNLSSPNSICRRKEV